jgi:hypothetical protein
MPVKPLSQACACSCGAAKFTVNGRPITRLLCHCLICQSIYRQPFADVTHFWSAAIRVPDGNRIRFKKYRPPPAVSRGTCPSCGAPVVGLVRLAPFARPAFVPSRNFSSAAELPAPSAHFFYHRRLQDVADELARLAGTGQANLPSVALLSVA